VHTHTHPDAAGAQVLELPRRGLSIGENARDGNRGGRAGQSAFTLDSSSTSYEHSEQCFTRRSPCRIPSRPSLGRSRRGRQLPRQPERFEMRQGDRTKSNHYKIVILYSPSLVCPRAAWVSRCSSLLFVAPRMHRSLVRLHHFFVAPRSSDAPRSPVAPRSSSMARQILAGRI
jgi:hypothetical protein